MQLTNRSYGEEPFDTSFRLFIDMNEQRFRSVANPTYVVKLTQPIYLDSSNIYVSNGSVLGTPDPSLVIPGIIHVNGERIIYYEKDGNRLSRLRRGVGGTGVPSIHLANSDVEDVGPNRYNNANQWTPKPEYRVYPQALNVPEGNQIRFLINTKYIFPGATLYWTNAGTAQIIDFVGYDTGYTNNGSTVLGGDYITGVAFVDITPRMDVITEGDETIIFQVRTGSVTGPVVATAETVTINDISIIPSYTITPRVSSIAEGSSIVYEVVTRGIPNGTMLYWSNEGTSQVTDFAIQSETGTVTVVGGYGEGIGYIKLDTIRNFGQSYGKSIVLNLRETASTGPILKTANVVYISDLPDPAYDIRATLQSYGGWAGNNQSISCDEGENVRFDFLTVGVEPKTLFFYEITGTVTGSDYSGTDSLTWGSFKTDGTLFGASASVIINIAEDVTTEIGSSPESLIFNVYSTRAFDADSYIIGPVTLNINDTSLTPVINVAVDRTSMDEGFTATFTITTEGIAPGTTLYWTNTGTTNLADFDSITPNDAGTVVLGGTYKAGTATVAFKSKQDLTPLTPDPEEGPETIIFTLYKSNPSGTPTPPPAAAAITVNIADTSKVTTTTAAPPPAVAPKPGEVLTNFFNGDFEIDTPRSTDADGVDHIPGWSIYKPGVGTTPDHLRTSGFSTILGCPTPDDPTKTYVGRIGPTPSPYGDQSPGSGFSYTWAIESAVIPPFGGKNVIRLVSSGSSVAFGIVRGPYLVSDNPISCRAGDKVAFNWKAEAGGDDFDVFAYLVEPSTCKTVLLLDSSSTAFGSRATPWQRVEKEISASEEGTYRFVFICGSQDESGGTALGASLYLDNIDKIPGAPPPEPWKLVVDNQESPPLTFTFTLTIPSSELAQTLSWFIVVPGTNTAFSGSGITGLNLGASNNLSIPAGPGTVNISVNAVAITGADQVFQMLITNGVITATEIIRSPICTIKPSSSVPEQGSFTLWGPTCKSAVGEIQTAKIRGRTSGTTVWGGGTGFEFIYTDDSDWSRAIVHAGLAVAGELVNIKFESLGDRTGYTGSTNNGVTTSDYSPNWCAVKISKIT